MEISRIARIHLVYQFIIITLLFLCIGYYEFLLDKKFIFIVGLVTIFVYQLATLSCYTELLPIAQRKNLSEILLGWSDSRTVKEPSESKESKEPIAKQFLQTSIKNIIAASIKTSNDGSCVPKPRLYKLRNSQTNGFSTGIKNLNTFNTSDKNLLQDSERTKVYFFPHRQKRLEQWIDSNGNARPYKISRVPNIDESGELDNRMTLNNSENKTTKDPVDLPIVDDSKTKSCTFPYRQKKIDRYEGLDESDVVSTTPSSTYNIRNRVGNIDESVELDNRVTSNTSGIEATRELDEEPIVTESKIRKSYTFPFRQKRTEEWEDSVETNEEMNTPSMPYWQSVEYSSAAKQKSRRRRSVSISNLKNQRVNNPVDNNDHKEFSQSLEISDTSFALHSDMKKSPFKTSNANFNKMKMIILNCFSKMKKDNSKTNTDRKYTDFKTRKFETYFQSRENLQSLEYEDECISLKFKGESEEHSHICTGYVPFNKRSFVR